MTLSQPPVLALTGALVTSQEGEEAHGAFLGSLVDDQRARALTL